MDDDGFRVLMFERWLRGHEVRTASTAEQAIRLLRRKTFDVVFLDHDLDGETLLQPEDRHSGSEVARFMARHALRPRTILHTHNPEGAEYMATLLPHAKVAPWGVALREQLPQLLWAE